MKINDKDISDLKKAKKLLEEDRLSIRMANLFGDAMEKLLRLLPSKYRDIIAVYTVGVIGKSWELTMTTMSEPDVPPEHERRHRFYAIVSGAVGGAGIVTLFAELPVTTVIMLRAVADIAKDEGEDYNEIKTKLACLEVFALGGDAVDEKSGETGYYATRKLLQKPVRESSKYIAKKGVAGMGAPFAVQLLAKIAARYQTMVPADVAAKAVPVAGAVMGATINIVFINYFQDKARGHFVMRRLEKKYGHEEVKQVYKATEIKETMVREVPKAKTDRILRHHVLASMGVGLIPFPIADFAGLTAVQLNLLRKLAKAYGIPFSKGIVKNTLASLIGGAVPIMASWPLTGSMLKGIPIIGQTVGIVTMPVIAGATTYAIGSVFVQHFASGGTFLTFDPEKVKDYYAEMFEEGKKIASLG